MQKLMAAEIKVNKSKSRVKGRESRDGSMGLQKHDRANSSGM